MSLNIQGIYAQMTQAPQVREATRKKAEKIRDFMEMRWPEVNDLSERDRAFLKKDPDRTILVTEATESLSPRPTHIVTVRHPGAVAKQAKTGFATKAVKDVE